MRKYNRDIEWHAHRLACLKGRGISRRRYLMSVQTATQGVYLFSLSPPSSSSYRACNGWAVAALSLTHFLSFPPLYGAVLLFFTLTIQLLSVRRRCVLSAWTYNDVFGAFP